MFVYIAPEGPVSSAIRQDNWFIIRDVISHARDDGQKALKRSKAVTNLLEEKRDDLLPLTAGTKTTNRRRYRHRVTVKAKHGRMPPNIGQLSDEKESETVMEVILTEEERRRLQENEEYTEEDKRRQERIKRLRKEENLECEKEKIDATAEEEKLLALIKTNEDTAPFTDRLDRLTEQELDDVIESIMKIDVG